MMIKRAEQAMQVGGRAACRRLRLRLRLCSAVTSGQTHRDAVVEAVADVQRAAFDDAAHGVA